MKKSFAVFAIAGMLLIGSASSVGAQSSSSGGSSLLGAFLDVVSDFAGAVSSIVEKTFNAAVSVPTQRILETTRTPVIKAPAPQPMPKPTRSSTGSVPVNRNNPVDGVGPIIGKTGQNEFKVRITNPSEATDAVWMKGRQYAIKWESTDPATSLKQTEFVSIYLVSAKDGARAYTISSKSYHDGEFKWTVSTRLADGIYKIVVQSVKNPSLKVTSSPISIAATVSRVPQEGDLVIKGNGQQTRIGEGGYTPDRSVWCCLNCYGESGGTCGGCFTHCQGGLY